jgi:hypothetical protein
VAIARHWSERRKRSGHLVTLPTGWKVLLRDLEHDALLVEAAMIYFAENTEAVFRMAGSAREQLRIVSICLAGTDNCVRP